MQSKYEEIEYKLLVKSLQEENRQLKDRILELETAIRNYGQAIGEDV